VISAATLILLLVNRGCVIDNENENYSWAIPYILEKIQFIVEVGSRDAIDAIHLSKHFAAAVFSFEPDPECYQTCLDNLAREEQLPISLYSKALSDTNGLAPFNVYSTGNSSLFKHKTEAIKSIEILQVNRFDALGISSPDLLVIDAQSCEYQILRGFGDLLLKTKYVIFETGFNSIYDSSKNFDACSSYLENLGFRFVATNVSGQGLFRFYLMRLRGLIYFVRKFGFRGFKEYRGFFDALFVNNSLRHEYA